MPEVEEMLHWAAPMFDHHESLLKMALLEKTYCQSFMKVDQSLLYFGS